MDFFGDFGLRDTFEKRIMPKLIEIDTEKLLTKFLTLNMDLYGRCFYFLGSRKLAHEGIKKRYPRKSRYFTAVGQSFVKAVADRHGHAAYYNIH